MAAAAIEDLEWGIFWSERFLRGRWSMATESTVLRVDGQ
jgi:hypothetical protein